MRASQLIEVAAIPTALIRTAFPTAVNVTFAVAKLASLKLTEASDPISVEVVPLLFAEENKRHDAPSPVALFIAVIIPSNVATAELPPNVNETIVVGVASEVVTCPVARFVRFTVTVSPDPVVHIPSS